MRIIALLSLIIALHCGSRLTHPAAAQGTPATEVVPQIGHSGSVTSIAVSSDEALLLSGSEVDNVAKLWDVHSGLLIREFAGHIGFVTYVDFAANASRIVTASEDTTVKIFEAATGQVLASLEHGKPYGLITTASLSPDEKLLATVTLDQTIRIWDLASRKVVRQFSRPTGSPKAMQFLPDGRRLVTGGEDGTARVWDVTSGRQLLALTGHKDHINSVAVSKDGRYILTGGRAGAIKLWNTDKGTLVREMTAPRGKPIPPTAQEARQRAVVSLAFFPDGRSFVSGQADNGTTTWAVSTGAPIKHVVSEANYLRKIKLSNDGTRIFSGAALEKLEIRDAATLEVRQTFAGAAGTHAQAVYSADGTRIYSSFNNTKQGIQVWSVEAGRKVAEIGASGNALALHPRGHAFITVEGTTARLKDISTGSELRTFIGHDTGRDAFNGFSKALFSPDGRLLLSAGYDKQAAVWNAETGERLRLLDGHAPNEQFYHSPSIAFLNNPKHVAVSAGNVVRIFDPTSGQLVKTLSGHPSHISFLAASPVAPHVLVGGIGTTTTVWDAASGRMLRKFSEHGGQVSSGSFSPDGKLVATGGQDKLIRVWSIETGALLRTYRGHTGSITRVDFSPDGRRIMSTAFDGRIIIWDASSTRALTTLMVGRTGEWISMTPDGFFDSSHRDPMMLSIVRGMGLTSFGQIFQSLLNPDLVRASLAGDPDKEVARAAKLVNLDRVLASGPAPEVAILSSSPAPTAAADVVTIKARITDRGKGIGRIEWRVNGITTGITTVTPGDSHDVTQTLALDAGDNQIEVIAYEARNVLASLPARINVPFIGSADRVGPKLYVLAIGINKYTDRGGNYGRFVPLLGSVPDAKAFAAELEKAAAGQYEKVQVELALDENATQSKLDEAIRKIAGEISPRDTFVFYAAAHGYSMPPGHASQGTYYMIPQDYQGGVDPDALKEHAIGQDRIQEWLSSRIKARRAVILLDTCESGALTGGYTKSRIEGTVSEAAVGRLHEATGRPVITAASPGKSAYENYKGHGVFTYALIEALHQSDTSNNGKIEISELAAHVQRRVPELFAELKQSGWVVKGVTMRGSGGDAQSAHFGSTGEDFSLVARLP